MPVSLLPILLFAQKGTVLLVGGEFQDLPSPVVQHQQYVLPQEVKSHIVRKRTEASQILGVL